MHRFATLSKYPPYISGHSHQAFWLGREMADLLGRPQHQLTYCGPVPPWYRDDRIVVHEVEASPQRNQKVPDGHLMKALAARMSCLAGDAGVTAFLALYADPHAAVAVRAARAARLRGHRVTVAVSVEGSDITSSLARHVADGEAGVLLADIAEADVLMAVSRRAAELLLDAADEVLGAQVAATFADRIVVRHPGLPPEAFHRPDPSVVARWRSEQRIPADAHLVSTYVRLVPEKGIDRILSIAEQARGRRDLVFAIAGSGPMAETLQRQVVARGLGSVRLLGEVSQPQAHLLRAASAVALLPSRRSPDWEETFGIAAVEYQALGVPVLATDTPGFAESCAVPEFRCRDDADPRAWLADIDRILQQRGRLSEISAQFAAGFTSRHSAQVVLDAVRSAAEAQLMLAL